MVNTIKAYDYAIYLLKHTNLSESDILFLSEVFNNIAFPILINKRNVINIQKHKKNLTVETAKYT